MNPTIQKLKSPSLRLKRLFTHDWEAKLIALVLALLLWYVVKDQVVRGRKIELPEGWPMTTSVR